jgi:hypothetical protein
MLALINEPLSEPPARVRNHWPALAKAMKRLDDARVHGSSYDAEVDRLRETLTVVQFSASDIGTKTSLGEDSCVEITAVRRAYASSKPRMNVLSGTCLGRGVAIVCSPIVPASRLFG